MEATLGTPFVLFARARGLSERSIVFRHTLRNAAVPIVTVVGIQFGVLLGGAIVIEYLFALPGIGRLVVTAINQRNYTVVQGGVLVVGDPVHPGDAAHRRDRRPGRSARRGRADGVSATPITVPVAVPRRVAIDPGRQEDAHRPRDPGRAGARSRSSRRCSRLTTPTRSNRDACSVELSLTHPFGSDAPRDATCLSRVIFSFRVSLSVAVGSVVLAFVVGIPLGLIAGYHGGWVDTVIMRPVDMLLALPALLLAIALIAIVGPGSLIALLAISVIYVPILARVIRSSTLVVTSQTFIEAARARGASSRRIVSRHVLPNAIGPAIVQASVLMGFALQIEAALSFLGSVRSRRRRRSA